MCNTQFHLLNTIDVSFYNLASIMPVWKNGSIDRYVDIGRSENLLFYLTHGERIYSLNNEEFLRIKKGDILFAPSKSHYESRVCLNSLEDYSTGICIKFSIKDEKGNEVIIDGPPQWVGYDIDGYFYDLFSKLHSTIMQGKGEKLYSKALLSQLIDNLITCNRRDKLLNSSYKEIYPAIVRIERYPQEQTSISELASLCFLSESTFRRKFQQYTGTSPLNYRNIIRIEKAIELLKSGIYTIEETAEAMGYKDQAHLCKMMKKLTGKTPKEIKKLTKSQ